MLMCSRQGTQTRPPLVSDDPCIEPLPAGCRLSCYHVRPERAVPSNSNTDMSGWIAETNDTVARPRLATSQLDVGARALTPTSCTELYWRQIHHHHPHLLGTSTTLPGRGRQVFTSSSLFFIVLFPSVPTTAPSTWLAATPHPYPHSHHDNSLYLQPCQSPRFLSCRHSTLLTRPGVYLIPVKPFATQHTFSSLQKSSPGRDVTLNTYKSLKGP